MRKITYICDCCNIACAIGSDKFSLKYGCSQEETSYHLCEECLSNGVRIKKIPDKKCGGYKFVFK
jgi:hypothetical protein